MTTFTSFQIEGNLITFDLTSELLAAEIKGQNPQDFGLRAADKLEDEIASAWGDAKAYWAAFQRRLTRLDDKDYGTSLTRDSWAVPLLQLLGYQPQYQPKAEIVEGQTFAISHRAEIGEEKPPVHIIGCRLKLEKRPDSGNPRLSAHALLQEYLNSTEHLWGIVTNGLQWRLLRDCSLMTRLSYIEFDLEQILNSENYAEFGIFYRLFHRTRLPEGIDDGDKCLLEFYHQQTLQQGGRVRDGLRDGVEKALQILGKGFLQHSANQELRNKVDSGKMTEKEYYRQLLLLIYRLLFLMVAEGRDMLLIGNNADNTTIYNEYYSITRLRSLSEKLVYNPKGFQDLWRGLLMTFNLFDENWRGEVLGLSPLNGDLFGSTVLATLDKCALDNHYLLEAVKELSVYMHKGQQRRVNYAALDIEELGSVYESLLDFSPNIIRINGQYHFKLLIGTERKTTGSYYTPPELVAQLIKTALEPVIEDKLKEASQNSQRSLSESASLLGKTDAIAQEQALLSIKVVDPACGSGHFLLAAARRIGKELARVRTNERQPGVEAMRQAIRDVIQNCIYGVDFNPLAVDLCKVALWIEGFNRGKPLSFLDHRIKWGNSLVGVLDLDCLKEGIPDEAYKAVTGDRKDLSASLKKQNKKERAQQDQLWIGEDIAETRSHYIERAKAVGAIAENSTGDVKYKQSQYRESRQDASWWRDYTACNLWTAAFFMPLTEQNLQLLPTSAALSRLMRQSPSAIHSLTPVVDAANKLAKDKGFFHWHLEFPEVFEDGGFSCVLGNPPWERIKLQEKEFFASRSERIANAANKAAREKLIKELSRTNPDLLQEFDDAKHDAEAQSKFIRESSRFPLTAVGDINTYAVFAETTRKIISDSGRVGIIVPTGIATDDTCKKFFGDLTQNQNLAILYDFENREKLFAAVDSRMKFSLLGMSNKQVSQANFSFFLTQPKQIEGDRVFQLSPRDIALINPNTLTCPVFRSRTDAELTKNIYQRVPVLENEKTGENPWGISFMSMFHMSNDSGLFKDESGDGLVPLYEGKMVQAFDHRAASSKTNFENSMRTGQPVETSLAQHQQPGYKPTAQYYVNAMEVKNRIENRINKPFLLAFKNVTSPTNERTIIASFLPVSAVAHSMSLIYISSSCTKVWACFLANLNSLVLDSIAKQKMGGVNLSFFILRQLPIITPKTYTTEDIKFISDRVLELVYTSWDMQPFAQDMGYEGDPFVWDEERRALLRAELDAYYAKLYGLTRDELRYILDPADVYGEDFPSETFRVLKNNEMKKYGEYRTQRLVLNAWDRMFG